MTAYCPVLFLSFLAGFAKSPGGPTWLEYTWSLTHKLLLSPGDKQVTSVTPLGAQPDQCPQPGERPPTLVWPCPWVASDSCRASVSAVGNSQSSAPGHTCSRSTPRQSGTGSPPASTHLPCPISMMQPGMCTASSALGVPRSEQGLGGGCAATSQAWGLGNH